MDFELTREQIMIKKSVKEFISKEIAPVAEEIDKNDKFPPGIWRKMGDVDLLGLNTAVEYGGSGYDILTHTLAAEEMAFVCPGLALSYLAHSNLCMHNLERNANEAQKKKYLPGLCSGELIGCLGLTEPDAGSDAVGITTSAVRDGDSFLLNGSKMFITNGPEADVAIVYTKTDMEKGSHGITAFIVEKNFPGYSVSRKLDKMGNRGSTTGELVFMDCRVPEANILGELDNGVKVIMNGLDVERVVLSGISLGMGGAALELALDYARNRKQFGQSICNFQLIKAKLANMYTELEAARGLVYRAAVLVQKTERGGKGTEVHKMAAAAILFAAEAASRAVDESLQIHGGYGYMNEFPINRLYRDAKLYEIGGGTSEVRRLLIANELI
ncbi:MAG: acyl-CoA dehydrogenase family protein [Deltaproteobacteria bacterium]|nr:acyl-CoA dehydrogenase family protein [Deltaproteobacteria bacterium]